MLLEERLAGATLLVFANKQDVAGSIGAQDITSLLRLTDLGSRHYKVVACSAVTGSGLDEGLSWLVGDIASRVFNRQNLVYKFG